MPAKKPHRGQELFVARMRAQRLRDQALNTRPPNGLDRLRHQCHDCHAFADDQDLRIRVIEDVPFFVHRAEATCQHELTA